MAVTRHVSAPVDGLISLFHFSAQPVGLLFGVYLVVRGQIDIGSLVFLAGLVGVMADALFLKGAVQGT